MFVLPKIAFVLWLFPSFLAPSHGSALGGTRSAALPVRASGAATAAPSVYASRDGRSFAFAAHKAQRHSGVAARATERELLLLAPRHRLLRRFVDPETGLVKRNVAAHCSRFRGYGRRHHRQRFLCRVWIQPRSPLGHVAVVCHTTAHHVFRLSAYEPRRKSHRTRH
jgi:hypothetical protein